MARSISYPAPECKGPEDKRIITPAGSKALEMADPGYSWWATIPMYGAMTLCGMAATNILMDELAPRSQSQLGSRRPPFSSRSSPSGADANAMWHNIARGIRTRP